MATSRTATVISKEHTLREKPISAIGKIIPLLVIAVCDDLLLGLSIILLSAILK
jgi:hypothetical protein